MTKGTDRATLELQEDEIKHYLDGRYIGTSEACWRLFQFVLHFHTPNVYRLPVHLPGMHLVRFHPDDQLAQVIERAAEANGKLIKYFEVCFPFHIALTCGF